MKRKAGRPKGSKNKVTVNSEVGLVQLALQCIAMTNDIKTLTLNVKALSEYVASLQGDMHQYIQKIEKHFVALDAKVHEVESVVVALKKPGEGPQTPDAGKDSKDLN